MIFMGFLKELGKIALGNIIKDAGKQLLLSKDNKKDNVDFTNILKSQIIKESIGKNKNNKIDIIKFLKKLKDKISKKNIPEEIKSKIAKKIDEIIDLFNSLNLDNKNLNIIAAQINNNSNFNIDKLSKNNNFSNLDDNQKIKIIRKKIKELKLLIKKIKNLKLERSIISKESEKLFNLNNKINFQKYDNKDMIFNSNNNNISPKNLLSFKTNTNPHIKSNFNEIEKFLNKILQKNKKLTKYDLKNDLKKIKITSHKYYNDDQLQILKEKLNKISEVAKNSKNENLQTLNRMLKKISVIEDIPLKELNDEKIKNKFNKNSQLFSSAKFDTNISLKSNQIKLENLTLKNNFEANIIEQIKNNLNNNIKNEVTIRLNPPELGKIHLKLVMINQELSAKITTENQAVKQAIINNINILNEALKEKGIILSNFNVNVQGEFNNNKESKQEKFAKPKKYINFSDFFEENDDFSDIYNLITEIENNLNLKV